MSNNNSLKNSADILNWNEEWLKLVSQFGYGTTQAKLGIAHQLFDLTRRFEKEASEIGKHIISELHLKANEKEIPPLQTDGVAGGVKYLHKGIFFKLASHSKEDELYGDDEKAFKSARHEFAGLSAYWNVTINIRHIYVPMAVMVDYRGHRLVAMSELPLNRKSLKYGCANLNDEKPIVLNEDPKIFRKMRKAAQMLNIKEHWTGSELGHKPVLLASPIDLEVHKGTDDNFYIIDAARVFPPEAPLHTALFIPADDTQSIDDNVKINTTSDRDEPIGQRIKRQVASFLKVDTSDLSERNTPLGNIYFKGGTKVINKRVTQVISKKSGRKEETTGDAVLVRSNRACRLIRQLRPELVRKYHVPLCSDAFGERQGLQSYEEADQNNQDMRDATNYLLEDIITKFAEDLNLHEVQLNDHFQLIQKLHERGINVRYLGVLRSKITVEYLQTFLLTEMCCRVIKNLLRAEMRDLQSRTTDEIEFHKLAVDYFNLVLGSSEESDKYWKMLKVHIQIKFFCALQEEERQVDTDLKKKLLLFPLFERCQETLGIRFTAAAMSRLFDQSELFLVKKPLDIGDIEKIDVEKKNIFDSIWLENLITRYVEESSTVSTFPHDLARDVSEAQEVLTQIKRKALVEHCFGQNSRELVTAWNDLANSFIKMGNYEKALFYAQRSFHAAERQYGDYSEETLAGLMALGEIEEKVGKKKDALKTFERALDAVKKLHHNHPLIALLNLKLYFLHNEGQTKPKEEDLRFLKKSFKLYSDRYDEEKAYLLAPLIAMKNNDPAFVGQILKEIHQHPSKKLLKISHYFWPKEHQLAVTSTTYKEQDANQRLINLLEKKNLSRFKQLFISQRIDYDIFLDLDQDMLLALDLPKDVVPVFVDIIRNEKLKSPFRSTRSTFT